MTGHVRVASYYDGPRGLFDYLCGTLLFVVWISNVNYSKKMFFNSFAFQLRKHSTDECFYYMHITTSRWAGSSTLSYIHQYYDINISISNISISALWTHYLLHSFTPSSFLVSRYTSSTSRRREHASPFHNSFSWHTRRMAQDRTT